MPSLAGQSVTQLDIILPLISFQGHYRGNVRTITHYLLFNSSNKCIDNLLTSFKFSKHSSYVVIVELFQNITLLN